MYAPVLGVYCKLQREDKATTYSKHDSGTLPTLGTDLRCCSVHGGVNNRMTQDLIWPLFPG